MDIKTLWKWNRATHRDVGYVAAFLTLIYAISGIVVNHVEDWNPNYHIEHITTQIQPVEYEPANEDEIVKSILRQLQLPENYKTTYRPDPETLRIFLDNHTIDVNLAKGVAWQEIVKTRFIIYEMNFLHLNHPKKLWTWVADIYAVSLALLAITGLFILKGKQGILGRGAWLTAIGVLIPVVFWLLYL